VCWKRGARVRYETDPPSSPCPCPSNEPCRINLSSLRPAQAEPSPVYIIISSRHHLHDQSTAFDRLPIVSPPAIVWQHQSHLFSYPHSNNNRLILFILFKWNLTISRRVSIFQLANPITPTPCAVSHPPFFFCGTRRKTEHTHVEREKKASGIWFISIWLCCAVHVCTSLRGGDAIDDVTY